MKIKITPWLILAILILSFAAFVVGIILLRQLDDKWVITILIAMIIGGFIFDYFEKKKNAKEKLEFLKIGKLLFFDFTDEFTGFYHLYIKSQKQFINQNKALLLLHDNLNLKDIKPIEVLYLFASAKGLVQLIDWKGEENEKEIETFIDQLLNQKPNWEVTSKFRAGINEDEQRDGKFIINLLKTIDKDLKGIKHRIVFFDLGWDAYVYTVTPSKIFNNINKSSKYFHGTSKLRK